MGFKGVFFNITFNVWNAKIDQQICDFVILSLLAIDIFLMKLI